MSIIKYLKLIFTDKNIILLRELTLYSRNIFIIINYYCIILEIYALKFMTNKNSQIKLKLIMVQKFF